MKMKMYAGLLLMASLLMSVQTVSAQNKKEKAVSDRELWVSALYQMAAPVLSNMSEGKLQENMQVELSPTWDGRDKRVTYMEAPGVGVEELCASRRPAKQGLFVVAQGRATVGGCRLCGRELPAWV